MYEKKDYIFSETLGVCRVDDITKLSGQQGEPISYYVLRSVFDKSKVSYIPVENHVVNLRELMTAEEAKMKKESSYKDEPLLIQQEIEYVLGKNGGVT